MAATVRAENWAAPLDVSGLPVRLVPLVLGYEPIPESISIRGGDPKRFLLEPVTGAAIVYRDGWILIDGGFNLDIVRDPVARREHFDYESYTAVVPPGDALAEGIAEAGLEWSQLRLVALSHVHLDHTGGIRLAPADTRVALQRREWAWVLDGAGRQDVVIPSDLLDSDIRILLLDGDTVLAPGLEAIDTRGHTPGHQSFVIQLADRRIVLACDAADLRRNIDERLPCGWTARPEDAELAERAITRLADLASQPGVDVWPGHDPAWPEWRR
jgi:glyoxylase-like metal-dependent hydrolase (beta-lactamase superfamily II)